MICPINPDRFTEMVEAERRLKFLERFVMAYGCGCLYLADKSFGERVDYLMDQHPELCEEITEVKVG